MTVRTILTALVTTLVLSGGLLAQVPRTEGKTLSKKPLVVADAIQGKMALLVITFSKKAGEAAMTWTKALQAKGMNSKCAIYQIAELEDMPGFFRRMAVSGMRKGVPTDKHDTFVILASDTQAWKDFVGFDKEENPYLVLIDVAGVVQYKISGEMTDERLKQITDKLMK